jgi:hAT family C-terminal dimerisation region
MAKDYLAIPASSTDSERAFSAARLIGTERRARLSAQNFEALQVLRSVYAANLITLSEMVKLRARYQHPDDLDQ